MKNTNCHKKNRLKIVTYITTVLIVSLAILLPLHYLLTKSANAADPYALDFNGSSDYIDIGDLTSFGTDSVTLEAWVKPEVLQSWEWILSAGMTGDNPIVGFSLNSSGRLVGYMEGDTTGQVTTTDDGQTLTAGTWAHVAVVFDRTTNQVTRYINGQQTGTINSLATIGSSTLTTGGNAFIASASDFAGHFNGVIDELRVWNVARTESEIQENMNKEITGAATGLKARWGFDEGTGDTTTDTAGSSIVGDLSGAQWITGKEFILEVSTSIATNVLADSVRLNATVVSLGNHESGTLYFKYGTNSSNLDQTSSSTNIDIEGDYSIDISGLNSSTRYYYKPYLESGADQTSGDTMYFGAGSLQFTSSSGANGGDFAQSDGISQITVEAWAKGTDYTDALIVSKHYGGADGAFYIGYITASTVRFATVTTNGRVDHDVTYALDSEWHHIAGVYDGSSMKLYIDGTQVGGSTPQTGVIATSTRDLIFGDYSKNDWPFTGNIDEVRIWNVARTPQEIQDNYRSEIESASGLIGRWGMNEMFGDTTADSSGNNTTITLTNTTWVDGYTFNDPPSTPTLTEPDDLATNMSSTTTLSASVTDPEENDMTVTFYGREQYTPDDDFTVVTLPDTQKYSASYPATFTSQTNWINSNLGALNIKMVLQEGDVVDDGSNTTQWTNAMTSLGVLDSNDIPNLIAIGNHDYDDMATTRAATNFNNYIPYATWYGNKDWFDGDTYAVGDTTNVYSKMDIGSLKFLFMSLEFGPRQEVIDWANQIITNNPDYQVIINTHDYMYSDNTRVGTGDTWNPHTYGIGSDAHDGEEMWDELVKLHDNIFMVTSGHILNDGLGYLESTGDNGNTVHQILANYQMLTNGGNGYLRYYVFKPSEDKIYAYTYSTTLTQFDTSSDNEFVMDYNFTTADDYTELHQDTGVSSGEEVSYDWSGLDEATTYEWYVTTDDGSTEVTSAVRSFTTGSSPTATFDNDFSTWESSDVNVNYNLLDTEGGDMNITNTASSGIEYSLDGNSWSDASDYGGSSEGYTPLSTTPSVSSDHLFIWDSSTDIPNTEDSSVYLRIRPSDGVFNASDWVTSNSFQLDNKSPSNIPTPQISNITESSITVARPSGVTENGSGLNGWYVRLNSQTVSNVIDWSSTSHILNNLSSNTAYTIDLSVRDVVHNTSSYGTSSTVYTKTRIPTSLDATSVSDTENRVTVSTFNNDTLGQSGYYFYRTNGNSGWITEATWDDSTVECGKDYTYSVKYRNAQAVESSAIQLSYSTPACEEEEQVEEEEEEEETTNTPTTSTTTQEENETDTQEDTATEEDNSIPEIFFKLANFPIEKQSSSIQNKLIASKKTTLSITVPENIDEVKGYLKASPNTQSRINKIISGAYAEDTTLYPITFTKTEDSNVYEAQLTTPDIPGSYIIAVQMLSEGEVVEEIEKDFTVINNGYIYAKIGGQELRIKDALITIYIKNSETNKYELWSSEQYDQSNPYTTNSTGEFSFFVPNGTYKIEVSAKGYRDFKSDGISVTDNILTQKIELKKTMGIELIIGIISVPVISFIAYIIYKKRKKL